MNKLILKKLEKMIAEMDAPIVVTIATHEGAVSTCNDIVSRGMQVDKDAVFCIMTKSLTSLLLSK